jgi:predicted RNA binding protein YcfA (HicA-like mRNA interferase family)
MGNRGTMTPKDVIARLRGDGWTLKKGGKGDHASYVHQTKKGKVTLDMGARDIPIGTLKSIFRQAGWEWSKS